MSRRCNSPNFMNAPRSKVVFRLFIVGLFVTKKQSSRCWFGCCWSVLDVADGISPSFNFDKVMFIYMRYLNWSSISHRVKRYLEYFPWAPLFCAFTSHRNSWVVVIWWYWSVIRASLLASLFFWCIKVHKGYLLVGFERDRYGDYLVLVLLPRPRFKG